MIKNGIVEKYDNDIYGYIIDEDGKRYDFSTDDISFNSLPLHPNDPVEFRVEDKGKELKLARNVIRIDKDE